MKKLNFKIVDDESLVQKHNHSLVEPAEGEYGDDPFNDDAIKDDVVKWDSATMTWSVGGNIGHHCINLGMAQDVGSEDGE
jgi:hypothetical protein